MKKIKYVPESSNIDRYIYVLIYWWRCINGPLKA